MVVDEVLETGKRERRFLIYDLMAVNGISSARWLAEGGRHLTAAAEGATCPPAAAARPLLPTHPARPAPPPPAPAPQWCTPPGTSGSRGCAR